MQISEISEGDFFRYICDNPSRWENKDFLKDVTDILAANPILANAEELFS